MTPNPESSDQFISDLGYVPMWQIPVKPRKQTRRTISHSQRERVWKKSEGICWYCGKSLSLNTFQVDHIHPVKRGGGNALENLAPSCVRCNRLKRALPLESFRYFLFGKHRPFWFEAMSDLEQEASK